MAVSITVAELCYLLSALELNADIQRRLRQIQMSLENVLTPDEIDFLRDQCGERLQAVGFDAEYEATEEGRLLETLVDKLYLDGHER